MRPPFVYLLLLALAVALGLAFLFGVRAGDGRAVEQVSGISPTSEPVQAAQPEHGASTLAGETAAVQGRETAAPGPPTDPVVEPSRAPAQDFFSIVVVRVVSKPTRAPLAGIRVNMFRTDPTDGENSTRVPGTKGSLSEAPLTTAEGRVEFAIPSGVDCTVWAYAENDEAGAVQAEVPALRPAESREITIQLPTGHDLRFVARVVADEDRKPIAGARVSVVRSDVSFSPREGRWWKSVTLSETSTGADGILDVSLQSWKRAHVRVEAEGFGLTLLAPSAGHETQDTALLVPLLRGAALEARVLDAAGAPLRDAGLRLTTRGYELNRPRREDSETGWVDLPDTAWTGAVGPDGRTVFRDLPPDVTLDVEILSDGEILRREADPLVIHPGQVLEREWRIGAGATLAGLVFDQADRPVAGLELWLTKSFSESSRYFDRSEGADAVAKVVTDAEGRFLLADVAAGAWCLGPAASTPYGERAPDDGIASLALRIEVAGPGRQEITLRVHRGVFIRGRVLDSHGQPAASTNVHASMEGADWGPQVDTEKDGNFALGPLAPGRFTLTAQGSGADAPSDPVPAEAGEKDVVLRLRPGGKLRGRVVDGRTGAGCRAEMLVMPENPGGGIFGGGVGFANHTDGSFEMEGLEPGRYGVAARTDDGRFGVVSGVDLAAGSGSDTVTVTVSEGGRLMLRYEGAREHASVTIRVSGVPIDWATYLERGKTVEKPAPAGALVLELDAERGGKPVSRSVVLAAGEEKEIVFRDGE